MLAVIGGTGLYAMAGLNELATEAVTTAYADAPVSVMRYTTGDVDAGTNAPRELLFLPRHGKDHSLPPHRVNYRANIDALKTLGANRVLSVNAVGGIHASMGPGNFAVPEQLIDYTYGREHTYSDGSGSAVDHIEFTEPYTAELRAAVLAAMTQLPATTNRRATVMPTGTYGCMQGPRLETAAEIKRLQRDGCDMVGMTGMPEAALAREAGLEYASLCLSVNWAAGLSDEPITLSAMQEILEEGMETIQALVAQLLLNS